MADDLTTRGIKNEVEGAAKQVEGKVRNAVGDATDNRDLQAEGQAEKSASDLKQGAEKAKDAFKD